MDIRLVRIDDRLIHGQVATVWTKGLGINRILVISDEVSRDTLRKQLLIQASPPSVHVNVIPVNKMIEVAFSVLSDFQIKAMLLFTTPKDIQRLIEAGIYIPSVNIGSMSFSYGKKMITSAIAVDQDDIEAFEYLNQRGVKLEIRKVPAESKVDLMELLNKLR